MSGDGIAVREMAEDGEYFRWLAEHNSGYVLSVRGRSSLLHRATCPHIDRHNNPGALTARGSRKLCADSKDDLRAWVKENGLGSGIALEKCPTCSP